MRVKEEISLDVCIPINILKIFESAIVIEIFVLKKKTKKDFRLRMTTIHDI